MKAILLLRKNNSHLQAKTKTVLNRMLLLLIACLVLIQAQSQADKRLVLADKYFAASEYLTAASLYGQFLNPAAKSKEPSDFPLNSKRNVAGKKGSYATTTDILLKQAESYRMANYWKEAAALYNECFIKDSIKYASALYWFAVCNRSMGNYSAAEESTNRFLNQYADNKYQSSALKEKQTLQFIKGQLAKPDSVLYHVQKMNTSFGTEKGFFAPAATASGFIITSTQADSVATGTNPYHNRLFHSTFADGTLQNFERVAIQSIDDSLNQGTATISADGNHLYFTQWQKQNGQVVSSIYYSTKTANGWSQPLLLSSVNQQGHNSKQPFCTVDGRYLFFSSDRAGGMGNFDIWYAPLQRDGTTGTPVNVGTILNTADNEQAPFYHNSTNTLVFASDRMPGMGGYDLFTAKGRETEWNTVENMGYPVNSSRDDVYFFTAAQGALLSNALFSSDRGSECCLATYTVSKTPKRRMMTGIVRDCRNNEPVADARVVLKDASGKTFETVTTADGKYNFELTDNVNQRQLFISKDKYNETSADMVIEKSNESNWLTDTLYNAELCIEKKLVIKVENVVTVYFDFDRSQLKDRGVTQLDSIYNVLVESPSATLQISGYTDGRGTVEYNKILSDKRAKACADYLIQKGIDAGRITFESFGACCPVEMEAINGRDNPDGRSMNRRALINISKD